MDLHAQITVKANKHLLTKHNQEFINTVAKYNFYPRLLQQIYSFLYMLMTWDYLNSHVSIQHSLGIIWKYNN